MIQFLLGIPEIVLYGCGILFATAIAVSITLYWQARRIGSEVQSLTDVLKAFSADGTLRRDGVSLAGLDEIRSRCEKLGGPPQVWWATIDSHIEPYTSPEEVEGWFLTENPRELLPYEIVVSKHFHSAFFSAFPGLLTGAVLTLTFISILLALYGVHYDKANS